jgi:hypothetical protein
VVDDGSPALSATNSFYLVVKAPLSPPQILSMVMGEGVATITWTSKPGQTYRLQYVDSITSTNWTEIPGDIPATGLISSAGASVDNVSQRFYRVRVLP